MINYSVNETCFFFTNVDSNLNFSSTLNRNKSGFLQTVFPSVQIRSECVFDVIKSSFAQGSNYPFLETLTVVVGVKELRVGTRTT